MFKKITCVVLKKKTEQLLKQKLSNFLTTKNKFKLDNKTLHFLYLVLSFYSFKSFFREEEDKSI